MDKHDGRGVIIGGIAASILGRPRLTKDLDAVFLLSVEDLGKFLRMAETENIVPRIENAPEFARKNRVLLLKHEPTQTEIDISLGILPFEYEMVERSHEVDVAGVIKLRLPTPEDLIIMKAIAHRPKDLEDIRNIVEKQKKLDRRRIRQWVTDFADALDNPEIWTEIQSLIEKA